MDHASVLRTFEDAQAILRGHFILSSGLHSDTYLQCARVLMVPERASRLCAALAEKLREALPSLAFDCVVAPAMGGVIVGYEMGRQLQLPSMFCERENGTFTLRRGFALEKNARVLVVEDVVTTGKSSRETLECIRAYGADPLAAVCLIDRSNGEAEKELGIPLVSLTRIAVQTFAADAVPDSLKSIPAVKPGSRWLQKSGN